MIRSFPCFFIVLAFLIPLSAQQGFSQNQDKENPDADNSHAAVIVDSGSTNTPGYRLVIQASGSAGWSVSRRRNSPACSRNTGKLTSLLTQKFFRDLQTLMPLSKLTVSPCAKSASFGSTLHVTYEGSTSPDLSCPAGGNEAGELLNDLAEINKALGVNTNVSGLPQGCEQTFPKPKPE